MNRRKNFEDTLAHKKPEQIILDFGGNPLSSMEGDSEFKLLQFLGFDTKEYDRSRLLFGKTRRLSEQLLRHFEVDTRSVGGILVAEDSQFEQLGPDVYRDEWGITRKFMGQYWESVDYPLKDATIEDLKAYRFPNANSIDTDPIDQWVKQAQALYQQTDYLVCAEHPVYGVFELGCWLCGFESFLLKMALEPEFVELLFEKILDYQKTVIELYYSRLGPYIHYTSSGDDYATQNGPFISPAMFADLVKPYFAERIRYTKQFTKAKYLHHSCGSVFSLMEELIDSGVEILNPIQPKARDMQPERLKEAFGSRMVFHGGIDTQELLPFAGNDEIEQTVKHTIGVMNQNGGYILAAAHNIQPDVKPEKLVVMLEAANRYRTFSY